MTKLSVVCPRLQTMLRASVRRAAREWGEDDVRFHSKSVVAYVARPDQYHHRWLLLKNRRSKAALETAHKKGTGYYRGVSHPFVDEDHPILSVEVKWHGFPDSVYAIVPFEDVAALYHNHVEFFECVSRWYDHEFVAEVRMEYERVLKRLPVRVCVHGGVCVCPLTGMGLQIYHKHDTVAVREDKVQQLPRRARACSFFAITTLPETAFCYRRSGPWVGITPCKVDGRARRGAEEIFVGFDWLHPDSVVSAEEEPAQRQKDLFRFLLRQREDDGTPGRIEVCSYR